MKNNKKRERILLGLLLLLLSSGFAACGKEKAISLEEISGKARSGQEETEPEAAGSGKDRTDKESGKADAGGEKGQEEDAAAEPLGTVSVYVCGAVHGPGVYELPAGSRLYQAVDAAGGMREDADRDYLNLAMELTDGMKLQVPTKEEVQAGTADGGQTGKEQTAGSGGDVIKETGSEPAGLVNINTADEARLMTLPGIGEAKAKSIIAYREEKGAFKKTEDIMNITGIKQAVYDKIKDAICVN